MLLSQSRCHLSGGNARTGEGRLWGDIDAEDPALNVSSLLAPTQTAAARFPVFSPLLSFSTTPLRTAPRAQRRIFTSGSYICSLAKFSPWLHSARQEVTFYQFGLSHPQHSGQEKVFIVSIILHSIIEVIWVCRRTMEDHWGIWLIQMRWMWPRAPMCVNTSLGGDASQTH